MLYLHKVEGKLIVSGLPWVSPEMEAQSLRNSGRNKKNGPLGKLFGPKFPDPKEKGKRGYLDSLDKVLAASKSAVLIAGIGTPVRAYLTKADMKALGKIPPMVKLYSLAEIFCTVPNLPECAILVIKAGGSEEMYAMCVAVSGHPLNHVYDVVVSRDKVSKTLETWTFELEQSLSTRAEVFGEWSGAKEMSFDSLLASSRGYNPMRSVGGGKSVVIGMLAATGILYFGYTQFEDYQRDQRIKEQRAEKLKVNPVLKYQNALAMQWPAAQWGSLKRVQKMQQWIGEISMTVGGFKVSGPVKCDVISGTCTFSYSRESGTFTSFKEALGPRYQVTSYGQDGKTAEVKLVMPNLPDMTPPALEKIPVENQTPFLFWPDIQMMPSSLVTASLAADYKIFPVVDGVNEADIPEVVRSATVTLNYPLWADQEMPPPYGVFVTAVSWRTITVTIGDKKSTVALSGDLYAKKTNGNV